VTGSCPELPGSPVEEPVPEVDVTLLPAPDPELEEPEPPPDPPPDDPPPLPPPEPEASTVTLPVMFEWNAQM